MKNSSKFILMFMGVIMVLLTFKSQSVHTNYIKQAKREFSYPYVVKINDHGVDFYITEEQNNIINTYYFINIFLIGSWLILFYVLKNRNRVENKKEGE